MFKSLASRSVGLRLRRLIDVIIVFMIASEGSIGLDVKLTVVCSSCMFRVFRSLGLYGGIPYDDFAHEGELFGPDLQLDPVTVAGSVKLAKVADWADALQLSFASTAIGWLADVKDLWLDGPPPKLTLLTETAEAYAAHLKLLRKWRVVRKSRLDRIWFSSRYFAVPKGTDGLGRSIFNGRALSDRFRAPPPVNLPEVSEITRRISALVSTHGKIWGCTADLRHWFHQISASRELRKIFGVICNGQAYEWACLPMGWSFSPRICQSIAWTLLLYHSDPNGNEDGLRKARASLRSSKDPPRFVNLHASDEHESLVGFVTLTYDNIIVIGTDRAIVTYLLARIRRNLDEARAVLKEWREFSPSTINMSGYLALPPASPEASLWTSGLSHLGVEYGVAHSPITKVGGGPMLRWRHTPSRLKKWERWQQHLQERPTCRTVSRIIGFILWDQYVALRPLCELNATMSLLRRVAILVGGRRDRWDEPASLSVHEENDLSRHMRRILQNAWHESNITAPRRGRVDPITICTDASGDIGIGAVILSPDGSSPTVWLNEFPSGLRNSHIFLKEMAAATIYVSRLCRLFEIYNRQITVVVDNSAVAFALRNMYSSNSHASDMLKRLFSIISERSCFLEVIQVSSENNPADDPSRGKRTLDPLRLARGVAAIQQYSAGLLSSAEGETTHRFSGADIRHPPGLMTDWMQSDSEIEDLTVDAAIWKSEAEKLESAA